MKLALTVLSALAGGVVLNLMPCVFPVLGIKVVGLVMQAGTNHKSVRWQGLAYAVGVLVSFWILAGVLIVLRGAGNHLGWGFQLQSSAFVFGLAIVMLLFALSLSGLFDFGVPVTGMTALQADIGYRSSFFMGAMATVVATPCSAPFLASALGAALVLPYGQSFLLFTAVAVGLSLPYLLLSMFPRMIRVLPRPGRWMESVKQAMAFPLYGTVAWLIWVLAGQTSESGLLMSLLGLTTIAMAAWLWGRYRNPLCTTRVGRFGTVAALTMFVVGVQLGWPRTVSTTDVVWEPWSAERVAQLRATKRTIYVDFTARWCATCQANKRYVFNSTEVKQLVHDRNIAALKADWTNNDPLITEELARWHRGAVPFNLVYRPEEAQPRVLPEILTPSIVLSALR